MTTALFTFLVIPALIYEYQSFSSAANAAALANANAASASHNTEEQEQEPPSPGPGRSSTQSGTPSDAGSSRSSKRNPSYPLSHSPERDPSRRRRGGGVFFTSSTPTRSWTGTGTPSRVSSSGFSSPGSWPTTPADTDTEHEQEGDDRAGELKRSEEEGEEEGDSELEDRFESLGRSGFRTRIPPQYTRRYRNSLPSSIPSAGTGGSSVRPGTTGPSSGWNNRRASSYSGGEDVDVFGSDGRSFGVGPVTVTGSGTGIGPGPISRSSSLSGSTSVTASPSGYQLDDNWSEVISGRVRFPSLPPSPGAKEAWKRTGTSGISTNTTTPTPIQIPIPTPGTAPKQEMANILTESPPSAVGPLHTTYNSDQPRYVGEREPRASIPASRRHSSYSTTSDTNISLHVPSLRPISRQSNRSESFIPPSPPQIFIIVRPPPSKQNHPLNLQIQLILPHLPAHHHPGHPSREHSSNSVASSATGGGRRFSGDYGLGGAGGGGSRTSSEVGTPSSFSAIASATVSSTALPDAGSGVGKLNRSNSMRSNRSSVSYAGSVGSTNSVGSSGSGHGGARRVTPLYNLGFHAVLATVVTDAGTDAKVAKFLKKGTGIDILGLGIIEPFELTPAIIEAYSPASLQRRDLERQAKLHQRQQEQLRPPPTPATPTITSSAPSPSNQPNKAKELLSKFKRFSFRPGHSHTSSTASAVNLPPAASSSAPRPSISNEAGDGGNLGPSIALFRTRSPNRDAVLNNPGKNLPVPAAGGGGLSSNPASASASTVSLADSLDAPVNLDPTGAGGAGAGAGGRRIKGYVWRVRKWTRSDLEERMEGGGSGWFEEKVWFEWRKRKAGKDVLSGGGGAGGMTTGNGRKASVREPGVGVGGEGGRGRPDGLSPPEAGRPRSPGLDPDTPTATATTGSKRVSLDLSNLQQPRPSTAAKCEGEEGTSDPNRLVVVVDRKAASNRRLSASNNRRPNSMSLAGARTPESERSRSPNPSIISGSEAHHGNEGGDGVGVSRRTSIDRGRVGAGAGASEEIEGDEDDSDPEDSESPWVCEMVTVKRKRNHRAGRDANGGRHDDDGDDPSIKLVPEFTTRVKRIHLGVLTPAPHHPKLVAQLSIPSYIPDILMFEGTGEEERVMSSEEMKDIVSVTCLWLVVREGLGGMGKRRKGDGGWRLVKT